MAKTKTRKILKKHKRKTKHKRHPQKGGTGSTPDSPLHLPARQFEQSPYIPTRNSTLVPTPTRNSTLIASTLVETPNVRTLPSPPPPVAFEETLVGTPPPPPMTLAENTLVGTEKGKFRFMDQSEFEKLREHIREKPRNYTRMLHLACKDPTYCLAFGSYIDIIKTFFNHFRNWDYVNPSKLTGIGHDSSNGFIIEVPFEREGYTSYAALKCSRSNMSDNLFYEYFVGTRFVNLFLKKIPNLVETYDYYEFKTNEDYEAVVQAMDTPNGLEQVGLKDRIKLIDIKWKNANLENLFGNSCLKNKRCCVLLQHFDNFTSMSNMYKYNLKNIAYEYANIFYQVYFTLVYMASSMRMPHASYTHYDLHPKNVFLYKPFEGKKCIQITYHRTGKRPITFKSEYIVKIIDYGRSYFYLYDSRDSKSIIENIICKSADCEPECGKYNGYNMLNKPLTSSNVSRDWIFTKRPNISHDLRFAKYYEELLKKLYTISHITYLGDYGTPEDKRHLKSDGKTVVSNIYDMYNALDKVLPRFNELYNHKKYDNTWTVVATMEIYDNDLSSNYKFTILPEKEPATANATSASTAI